MTTMTKTPESITRRKARLLHEIIDAANKMLLQPTNLAAEHSLLAQIKQSASELSLALRPRDQA